MDHEFDRKIFTARMFIMDTFYLIFKLPTIIGAFRNKKITKAFMEKIMMVVTAVNGCTYCTWFHAKQAISSGISEEEVKNMLKLQFEADASDFETTGLLFAQHYAETDRRPDNDMTYRLFQYYGQKTAKQIMVIIRIIFWGNLTGNTSDAFLSRLKGVKAKNSNVIFETIFFILTAPLLLPLFPVTRRYRNG